MSDVTEQLQKMKTQPGFIAALDQSGGSTPGALQAYGIQDTAWSSEAQMFEIVHQMRTLVVFRSLAHEGQRAVAMVLHDALWPGR